MSFDELFNQRSLIALKLKGCIRDKGFTKVSFAEKAGISRPTLDKLLNGTVNSKSTYDKHLQKILKTLNLSADELMLYNPVAPKPVQVLYSENAPADHERTDIARKQYNLLLDVIDLCTIYY